MLKIVGIPAFSDNYLWVLHDGKSALVVDPGDAAPVLDTLAKLELQLVAILVTHHHFDHIGGVPELRRETGAKVYGPAFEDIPEPYEAVSEVDTVAVPELQLQFQVLDVPGHTAGHIAYYSADVNGNPLLFCGDTLFSGGCGRIFEGTPAQMLASLDKLAALPPDTVVCCTHEYTLSNLRFAAVVDPANSDLSDYQTHCKALRAHDKPTLPTSIGQELRINPFLRTREPALVAAAHHFDAAAHDETTEFAAIRQWKNQYQ